MYTLCIDAVYQCSLVHRHQSYHCGAHIDGPNDHSGQQSHLSAAAQALKQLRGIEDDTVDPGELLQSRHNDGQQQLRAVGRLADGFQWLPAARDAAAASQMSSNSTSTSGNRAGMSNPRTAAKETA